MTPEERNTVIEALSIADVLAEGRGTTVIREALAIMRREREETTVPHVHKWFRTGEMTQGLIRCIECGLWGEETHG